MSSGVTWSMSPCMIHSNPSRTPSTSTASNRARMVAAPITLLMPGAGPPPTRLVAHAIVNDPVHHVHGILVRRGLERLDAAALIDRHVHDDRARLHELQVVAPHQFRGLGPGQEHRADDEIGPGELLEQVVA